MKKPQRRNLRNGLLMLFIPLIIGLITLAGFLQAIGAIDLKNYFNGTSPTPWPAYDAEYRLDKQDEPLSEEQITYFADIV